MELCSFPSFPKVWDLSAGGQGVGGELKGGALSNDGDPSQGLLHLPLMTAAHAEAGGSKEQKSNTEAHLMSTVQQEAFQSISQGDSGVCTHHLFFS